MAILTVGPDLATIKSALPTVNDACKSQLLQPRVCLARLYAPLYALLPRIIGIEAFSGAYELASPRVAMRAVRLQTLPAPTLA